MADSFVGSSRVLLTGGDEWKTPKGFPVKHVLGALAGVLVIALVGWMLVSIPRTPEPVVDDGPQPEKLTVVQTSGVSTLLHVFSTSPNEVHSIINEGVLKATAVSSVTGDGQFGFGTITVANIDATTLLAEGSTYIKGSPAFWSALGMQTAFPGWIHTDPEFLGGRIFFPAGVAVAILTPVESSRILGDDYTASHNAKAKFGKDGVESMEFEGYEAVIRHTNNEAVLGTAIPLLDGKGAHAEMVRLGTSWVVNPPPPVPDGEHNDGEG